MRYQGVIAGYVLGIMTLVGCASTGIFPWPYYSTQMDPTCYDKGVLLGKTGKKGWPDAPLSDCKPDPVAAPGAPAPQLLKCITSKVDDFYAEKAAYLKCQQDLIVCQSGPNPVHSP